MRSSADYLQKIEEARRSGQLERVVDLTKRALKHHPSDVRLKAQYARDLHEVGRNAQALHIFDELIHEEPENQQHLTAKGAVQIAIGQLDDALENSLAATKKDPAGWLNVARVYREQGKLEKARDALTQCIQKRPENILARNALNMLLFDMDEFDEARIHGQRSLELKRQASLKGFATLRRRLQLDLSDREADPGHQNIIAFSLWGDQYMYLQGAIENLKIAPVLFADWRCRIYHDASVPGDVIERLDGMGAQLILVSGALANLHGGFWRFAVANDPTVERFIIRDADGRLNDRDATAVQAWVNSNQSFHVMRDHIYHTDLILAGMWGGFAGTLPDLTTAGNALYGGQVSRWNDQLFLARVVWPLIENDCLVHDSYYHHLFNAQPFPPSPVRSDHNFIGRGLKIEGWMKTIKVPSAGRKPR